MTAVLATRDVRVCVFGDSFVAGVGDPKALGWVGRVAARTPASTGVALTMYALGVRGESVEDVVVRMPLETSPRFARGDEHGVVLAVPANAADHLDRSIASLEFGLTTTSARRLVVGLPPVGPAEEWAAIGKLDEALAALCEHLGVPYISTYRGLVGRRPWVEQELVDGVHPGQAGYGMLAYAVLHGGWYEWLGVQPPAAPIRRRHNVTE